MSHLLDTHTFLWSLFEQQKLSNSARKAIENGENTIYLSVISIWEISLKFALKKLHLENCSPKDLPDLAKQMQIEILELNANDAASFYRLPIHHKDPFDRMLIMQAIKNDMVLISKDSQMEQYQSEGLRTVW